MIFVYLGRGLFDCKNIEQTDKPTFELWLNSWKNLGADLGFWLLSNKQLKTRSGGIKRPFCRISFVVKVVPINNRLDNAQWYFLTF